jgi:hypothetical protein
LIKFYCIASMELECLHVYVALIDLLQKLGFDNTVSQLVSPTQFLTFLCVLINSVTRRLVLSDVKVLEIANFIDVLSGKSCATKNVLQVFLGKLNWACRMV